jgi:hypothetical protein
MENIQNLIKHIVYDFCPQDEKMKTYRHSIHFLKILFSLDKYKKYEKKLNNYKLTDAFHIYMAEFSLIMAFV